MLTGKEPILQNVSGRVVDVTDNAVIVDVGGKSADSMPLREFTHSPGEVKVAVGDEVEVLVGTDGGPEALVFHTRPSPDHLLLMQTASEPKLSTIRKWLDAKRNEDSRQAVDEIDQLYADIAELAQKVSTSEPQDTARLQAHLESQWSRLRQLQEAEADTFYRAFESQLDMPIDAGAQLLREANALRSELEDTAVSDAPSE